MNNGYPVTSRSPIKLLKAYIVIVTAVLLGGCCGMTSIQSHGGGAGGFASLGAMILGTAAMQRICEPDRAGDPANGEVHPPPETAPEETGEETSDSGRMTGVTDTIISPFPDKTTTSQQMPVCQN